MVIRDDDDMDLEEATSHAAMLQHKQQMTFNGQNKRKEQLLHWESSEMNGESQTRRRKPRVKFQDADIFLSACMSGDEEEVEDLLEKGADINTATVDGLTALHQSVIDSKPEMVRFLCEKGADVNAQDNEGWTPLHAAACCGNLPIVKYLCEHGADISIINSDKELAMDLADDEECREFLEQEHENTRVDPQECRDAELTTMMDDANKWIRDGVYKDLPHSRTGATAMHVASAKGYTQLLELLIQAGGDIRVRDRDGWTPLHAAAHWGERDSCKILMEHGATIKDSNSAGQDVTTVADKDIVEYLEELEKAAEARRSLPTSNGSVLQDKNSRVTQAHHEEHTITTDHKRELQHRDQSSEKEVLHSFAKVPRIEKSPSAEPSSPVVETRKVPSEEAMEDEKERASSEKSEKSSIGSRISVERSKSGSEPPSASASIRSSEERMSARTTSESVEKSMSVDRHDRSSVTSATPSTASTASSLASSMATTASTSSSAPVSAGSLQGDQNVSAVVPLRPLQQPNSWINRGVQLVSRSNSSGSTRTMSTESSSQASSLQQQATSAASSASPAAATVNPVFTKPLFIPSYASSVQRSTSIPSNLPWASLCRSGTLYPPGVSNNSHSSATNPTAGLFHHQQHNFLSQNRVSAFRPLVKNTTPTGSSAELQSTTQRGHQPQHLSAQKMRPWQSNAVNESEAERRSTARLQRQNRRSTQGVTKEQLEEARGLAAEEALRRRGSSGATVNYGGSSGTAIRENPALVRLASEERDFSSERSDSIERVPTAPARINSISSMRNNNVNSEEKTPGRLSPPTASATLSLAAVNSPGSTPSAANIRRRSQQGMPLSRSNRRGTGPVTAEDLQLAKPDGVTTAPVPTRNGLSSTVNRTFLTFNRTDPSSSSVDKSQSAPPGSPTAPTSAPPLRSAAINPINTQRVTARVAVQPHNAYTSQGPQTSAILSRPTETNLNYKALYEKERSESERLRKELDELRRSQDNSLPAYRSINTRYRNGTSTASPASTPLGKSPSGSSVDDVRALERKVAEMELQAKTLTQLKTENERLKEENGALVRVISKMTT